MFDIQIGRTIYRIDSPEKCPICHRHMVPEKLAENITPKNIAQVVFRCQSDKCRELFIAYYALKNTGSVWNIFYRDSKPKNVEPTRIPEEVSSISPNFVEIYNQAKTAEENNLDEICGPGYRKSLEFLIKDYLIKSGHPEDEIKGKFLGACINMIQDNRIKLCAERATWLGNDETHYVRKWEQQDIANLKELIELTIHWISMELITLRYENEMPRP